MTTKKIPLSNAGVKISLAAALYLICSTSFAVTPTDLYVGDTVDSNGQWSVITDIAGRNVTMASLQTHSVSSESLDGLQSSVNYTPARLLLGQAHRAALAESMKGIKSVDNLFVGDRVNSDGTWRTIVAINKTIAELDSNDGTPTSFTDRSLLAGMARYSPWRQAIGTAHRAALTASMKGIKSIGNLFIGDRINDDGTWRIIVGINKDLVELDSGDGTPTSFEGRDLLSSTTEHNPSRIQIGTLHSKFLETSDTSNRRAQAPGGLDDMRAQRAVRAASFGGEAVVDDALRAAHEAK